MTAMSVSAVIPAHNAEPFLRDAIESVLQQTVPVELIVVNDGSTDGTDSIIESYGAQVIHLAQGQRGLGASRNRGIAASHGAWIAFLDADDIWTPEKTELQLKTLKKEPLADMIFGHCVEFADPGSDWPARTQPFPAYSACAMLARRTLFDEVGGFAESREIGEFLDWYSRATHAGARPLMLEELVFRRRVHGGNMTRDVHSRQEQRYLDVVRAHLRRRREAE